jgi:hypothetical protein
MHFVNDATIIYSFSIRELYFLGDDDLSPGKEMTLISPATFSDDDS